MITDVNIFLYWWLLPALCVLLFQFQFFQRIPKKRGSPERGTLAELFEESAIMKTIILLSIFWPIGVITYIALFGFLLLYANRVQGGVKNIMKLLIKDI